MAAPTTLRPLSLARLKELKATILRETTSKIHELDTEIAYRDQHNDVLRDEEAKLCKQVSEWEGIIADGRARLAQIRHEIKGNTGNEDEDVPIATLCDNETTQVHTTTNPTEVDVHSLAAHQPRIQMIHVSSRGPTNSLPILLQLRNRRWYQ